MITYDEAVKAQSELEDKLLEDPNVVSVGVVAETNELAEKTGSYIIKVGVISSEEYQNSVIHGESLIPMEYELEGDDKTRKFVHIKVVRTGQINALSSDLDTLSKRDFPSAVDDIPSASTTSLEDYRLRKRPTPCGYSIGHSTVTAGTLGLIVEYTEGPNLGKAYALSNNHVMSANNLAHVWDDITQPGKYDSGTVGKDTIAFLHRWVPLVKGVNFVDAAIAEIKGELNWSTYVVPYVAHIGYPADFTNAQLGMRVEKTGRTTGYTMGTVISVNQTVKVNYGKTGLLTFKNQICTTNMSKGGDSGSCLFESGTKKPVGLLFAGDDSESFHNPISAVLSSLSKTHVNQYPSGKTHVFPSDYPLRIMQRRTYSTVATVSACYRKSGVFVSSFRRMATRNKVAAVACLGGICAITIKLANSSQLDKEEKRLLFSRVLTSQFFKPAPVRPNIDTTRKPGIDFRR